MNNSTRISGYETVDDWKDLRNRIREDESNIELWNEAFTFYQKRLDTRYFKPINDIKGNDKNNGEGFTITAILCSLIEFLETTYTGEVYRFCKDKELQSHEYNKSSHKFKSFFEKREPFNLIFTKANGLAKEFYEKVRCGLLHEASTKGNWIIRTDNFSEFHEYREPDNVIDRNIFELKIKEYLTNYKAELLSDIDLQEAFIRKLNDLSGLNINY